MYPEVFNRFNFKEGRLEKDIIHTRCGSVQLRKYDAELSKEINFGEKQCYEFYCRKEIPIENDAVFEWLDICESIQSAKHQYTFVELGAGHARWAVIAYYIASKLNALETKLIIVEAEPTHFEWAIDHLRMNHIESTEHSLFQGAVDTSNNHVLFQTGEPSAWYGQSILSGNPFIIALIKAHYWWRKFMKSSSQGQGDTSHRIVKSYSLTTILTEIEHVDLIHMDIQGKEFDVLSTSTQVLNDKVKRIHIGTHSAQIEKNLRELMLENGWHCLRDYNCNSINDTPFGEIRFEDGIQTWTNPAI